MLSMEYVWLKDANGDKDYKFIPGVEFDIPEGKLVNINYATLKDGDNTIILKPGQIVENKQKFNVPTTKEDLKEFLNNKGVSFPSKATVAKLQEIVNANI